MHIEPLTVYKALADESRLRLIAVLALGYFNVQELTSILALSQATVSHHLRVLQTAGVARSHKEGTWTYHALANGTGDELPRSVAKNFLALVEAGLEGSFAAQIDKDQAQARQIMEKRRGEAHRYFETVAGEWKELRDEALGGMPQMDDLRRLIPDDAVLADLGCGSGSVLEQLLPRAGATIGVDYSQSMLDEARRNLDRLQTQVDLRLGTLEHLPLADASIDVALAHMVMHHIAHPPEALKDVQRVLRKDGRLIVVDLKRHSREYMRERYADLWLGFDPAEFERWLTAAGFRLAQPVRLNSEQTAFMAVALKA